MCKWVELFKRRWSGNRFYYVRIYHPEGGFLQFRMDASLSDNKQSYNKKRDIKLKSQDIFFKSFINEYDKILYEILKVNQPYLFNN